MAYGSSDKCADERVTDDIKTKTSAHSPCFRPRSSRPQALLSIPNARVWCSFDELVATSCLAPATAGLIKRFGVSQFHRRSDGRPAANTGRAFCRNVLIAVSAFMAWRVRRRFCTPYVSPAAGCRNPAGPSVMSAVGQPVISRRTGRRPTDGRCHLPRRQTPSGSRCRRRGCFPHPQHPTNPR